MDNDMLIDQIKEHLFWIKKESGLLLLEIRQRNGLTRLFVAESINMSQRNLSTIEREYKATLDEILKLYTFYHSKSYGTAEDDERFRRIMRGG
ncbi:helix-turn-helix transcriptional regulator [Bacteroides sp. 51]|uniref:helix-turn-helix domain-containing protein n=1 Tax=Bacteroides sp. 51 TaxID=2302938 RepID=UPI0013D03154|nr:helix-turn-helix transcriptional regulator [Bacteroides sp. 51]NDV83994.1 XRE family transcriptional regulator [Bacteroides sp. 51]